jgi:sodium-coupled monocarboxylate transporter 8/12
VISIATGLPVWQCVLLMGLATTLYTALGGMKAVIWTDVIQFCTVMLGLTLITWFALERVDGGIVAAYQTALTAGRLKLFNLSTDPSQLTSFWACVIGGTVLSLAPLVTDQAILQRLFTTKSEADCKQSIIAQVILVLPTTMFLYLTGTVLFVFYHMNPSRLNGLVHNDTVMPFFAIHELPSGVAGLIVASIFAASMAVMSAGINSLTTASVVDFYQRLFRPQASSQHYASVGRIGTVCWGVLLTGLALFAKYLGDLALGYNHVSSILSGPMLGIFLLGVITTRSTSGGVLAGAGSGMLVVAWFSWRTDWSFFLLGPVGVASTIVVGYLASLLMRPPSEEQVAGLALGRLDHSTEILRSAPELGTGELQVPSTGT